MKIPQVTFRTRIGDNQSLGGGCAIGGEWKDITSDNLFKDKKIVLFSLPGAYTPTCSSQQVPGYEDKYEELKKYVNEVYCLSVNDSFVMNAWAKNQGIKNVKMIPDGNGSFTKQMGMLISKNHLGFGERSWRYSMVCNNGVVEKWNEEPGRNDTGADEDPYESTDPDTLLKQLGAKTFMQDIANQY